MKKIIYILFFILIFKNSLIAQIKEVKENGFSINVYNKRGEKTGSYTLQNENEEYLDHNATYFLIKRMNSILVFDSKGRQFSKRLISVANNRSFSQITEKSIWIEDGPSTYYYDFSGNRLSNYSEE